MTAWHLTGCWRKRKPLQLEVDSFPISLVCRADGSLRVYQPPSEHNSGNPTSASLMILAHVRSFCIKARPRWDVYAQVEAISKVTPPYFSLDLDWNKLLLNAGNAAPVLSELDRQERVKIYESPIMQRDVEGQRQPRQKTTRPIALHFGEPPFPTVVRDEVCDGFVIGGGVARVLREGTLAAAFEKPFWLQMVGTGLTTTLSAHLGAVLPFAQWPAVNSLTSYLC
jgi:L-alanine-DL-glutamate epimerase-like enolase superfamily enzyme